MATIRISVPHDLGPAAVEAIAFDGARIELGSDLLSVVEGRRAEMLAALRRGASVYAVTTGTGYQSKVRIDDDAASDFQANMLLGRAVGSAPYLPRGEARALMATRLVSLTSGVSGASAALCRTIAERLNADLVPAVPRRAAGTAGEVIALSHAFQTLMGVGVLLGADEAPVPAGEALARAGAGLHTPREKEGIALLAGAPGSVALALGRVRAARRLAATAAVAAACAITAIDGPHDAYDGVVADLAGDPVLGRVNASLRALLGPGSGRAVTQTPVSFRVVPQVHAQLARTIARLEEDTARSLGAISDSPAFVGGRFVSTGAFHDIGVASGFDALAIAYAQVAELATQHAHRLLDSRFTGLPDQLSPRPGFTNGPVVVHKRMVGAVNELRRLAAPCTLGLAEASLGQEDAETFAFEGAERLRRVEELVLEVCACGILVARHAWWMRAAPPEGGLAPVAAAIEAAVPPLERDRPYGADVDALTALLADGALTSASPASGGGPRPPAARREAAARRTPAGT